VAKKQGRGFGVSPSTPDAVLARIYRYLPGTAFGFGLTGHERKGGDWRLYFRDDFTSHQMDVVGGRLLELLDEEGVGH